MVLSGQLLEKSVIPKKLDKDGEEKTVNSDVAVMRNIVTVYN